MNTNSLWFWLLAAVAARVVMWVVRRAVDERSPALDLYQIAFLAGGLRRVCELALVQLHERGAIRVSRNGIVTKTGLRVDDSAIEGTVLATIRGGEIQDRLPRQLASRSAVKRLRGGLIRRGLVRLTPAQVRWCAVILAVVLLTQVEASIPVAVVVAIGGFIVSSSRRPVTRRGRTVLNRATQTAHHAPMPHHVALHGLSAYWDQEVAAGLTATPARARRRRRRGDGGSAAPGMWVSSDSGGYCGGGSSCGAAGCGSGGGCGGGGGGGGGCGGGGG